MKIDFHRMVWLIAGATLPLTTFAQVSPQGGSASLSIAGTISPSACVLSLDKAALALGQIPYGTLADNGTLLPLQRVNLSIVCEGPTLAHWQVADNRKASVPDADSLRESEFPKIASLFGDDFIGLGLSPVGKARIGALRAGISPGVLVDGAELGGGDVLTLIALSGTGLSNVFTRNGSTYGVQTGRGYTFANRVNSTNVARRFTTALIPLEFSPFIVPRRDLPSAEKIDLDGSLTFTLNYF